MHPGDFVLTPSWQWHDHGNETSETVVWMDGLDVPLTKSLNAMFFEMHKDLKASHAKPDQSALAELSRQLRADMTEALNNDLNAPQAVATLFDFVRAANRELDQGSGGSAEALAVLTEFAARVLDIFPTPRKSDQALESWIEAQVAARNQARKSKDFKAADAIRAELRTKGVEIEDTPTGTKWRVV